MGGSYESYRAGVEYLIESGIKILTPNIKTVEEVLNCSERTGDLAWFSETDIEILSLAKELDGGGCECLIEKTMKGNSM